MLNPCMYIQFYSYGVWFTPCAWVHITTFELAPLVIQFAPFALLFVSVIFNTRSHHFKSLPNYFAMSVQSLIQQQVILKIICKPLNHFIKPFFTNTSNSRSTSSFSLLLVWSVSIIFLNKNRKKRGWEINTFINLEWLNEWLTTYCWIFHD